MYICLPKKCFPATRFWKHGFQGFRNELNHPSSIKNMEMELNPATGNWRNRI